MLDKQLLQELGSLREVRQPSAIWRTQTRQRILQLAEAVPLSEWQPLASWRLGWLRTRLALAPLPALALVVVVLVFAAGSVPLSWALASSRPGQWLYPVKRLEERVEVSFRQSAARQGAYYLTLAGRRLDELASLPVGDRAQGLLLRDYNIELAFAEANYQAADSSPALAQLFDQSTGSLANRLSEVVVADSDLSSLNAARSLTHQVNGEALSALVALHQPGQNGGQQQAVTQRLEEEIAKVEQRLASVQTKLGGLPVSERRASRVVLESRRTVVPATEAGAEASKSLAEAKQLLQKKQFSLALEKVKEGEVITLKTEEAITEAEAKQGQPKEGGEVKGAEQESKPPSQPPADGSSPLPSPVDSQPVAEPQPTLPPGSH